jgi:DNA-binding winged helix-turn-helix (wHTH) protein/alpha-beta hydrolase superfamily lysophospholipase
LICRRVPGVAQPGYNAAAARSDDNVLFLFDDFVIDTGRRELRSRGQLIAVEPQVFDLLVHLIENRERVVSKDDLIASVWKGRIVSDSTLDSRINAARKAIGDSGGKQDLIRTVPRKGVRFVGAVRCGEARNEAAAVRPAIADKQQISFCRGSDNTRIAYATIGNGMPLIKTAHWLTHLEYDWVSPVWSPTLHWLASKARLIRYDGRANGLSDREVDDVSFDAFVRDFEAVVEATGLDTFALLGVSQGAAIAIDYAARHPERVTHLVLHGGYVQGRKRRGSAEEIEKAATLLSLMRQGWGDENSGFMRAFASLFIPNGSPEQIRWFANLQRATTTADNAARIRGASENIDVSNALGRIRVPTLVTHSRHDNVVPLEQGLMIAAAIPGAQFVTLESENHVLLSGEPAWSKFAEEAEAFLGLSSC